MINKILTRNSPASVLLTTLLVLGVSIMTIGFGNAYFKNQIHNYQRLDNFYKQKIVQKVDKTDTIRFSEYNMVE
ncbi:hypothetical protein [Companilactobacillus kedongensis]|uniref:hypothetical protein n=1 Tax=Companilactobacillus kedongensis TaxID=2486004 RepID=UPI000F782151|nr:hypothetical protein [Companilactobacillus kedongensis]